MKELALITANKDLGRYAIQVIIDADEADELLLEHKVYQTFKKTNNRYTYHPENTAIPVKGHYHIYPSNSKKEIYAVNLDGTAHHKDNRGYEVPKKEAEELRTLGVKLKDNNILEWLHIKFPKTANLLLESANAGSYYSLFIIIDGE